MGNSLGGKKTTKVMKLNGETIKLKTPVKAVEVVKDYPPGYVLLESEAVKHFGIRAKPLKPDQNLEPKRLYFLVELPTEVRIPRRAQSAINMSAKDRLESLILARRSVSDLSILKPVSAGDEEGWAEGGGKRVKMRVPKKEVERLMKESENKAEAAAKIVDLCVTSGGGGAPKVPHWGAEQGRARGGIKASTAILLVVAAPQDQLPPLAGHKNMIIGGVEAGSSSSSQRKKQIRQCLQIESWPTHFKEPEWRKKAITFTEEDAKHVKYPQCDALVATVRVGAYDV